MGARCWTVGSRNLLQFLGPKRWRRLEDAKGRVAGRNLGCTRGIDVEPDASLTVIIASQERAHRSNGSPTGLVSKPASNARCRTTCDGSAGGSGTSFVGASADDRASPGSEVPAPQNRGP